MATNRRKSRPGKTLMGFVAIVAIVAVFNVRDSIYREWDEESYYPTALGDNELFRGHLHLSEGERLVDFEGKPLVLAKRGPVAKKDWAMIKVGRDDSKRHFIYREAESSAPDAAFVDGFFYLKVEQGEAAESRFVAALPESAPAGGEPRTTGEG